MIRIVVLLVMLLVGIQTSLASDIVGPSGTLSLSYVDGLFTSAEIQGLKQRVEELEQDIIKLKTVAIGLTGIIGDLNEMVADLRQEVYRLEERLKNKRR